MKAIVYTEYGTPDVLHLQEVTQPTPQANEVLVRVHAAAVNIGDLLARRFGQIALKDFSMPFFLWLPARLAFGLRRPKRPILGSEFAGEVTAVGSAVTRFKPGDAVFGYRAMQMGAHAEYVCMPEDGVIAPKPANMSYAEAAAVPYGALTALNLLRAVNIQPGQHVLVNGASGGIGSYAVQLARHAGAEVTGVCSTPRLALVKALGAAHVIDYTREDFTTRSARYDLILDILNKSSFARCRRVLTPTGRYLLASFKLPQLLHMLWTKVRGGQQVVCALASESQADLHHIKGLIEAGHLKAVIDRCYPLAETAEAHRYIEAGRRQGQVIISLMQPAT